MPQYNTAGDHHQQWPAAPYPGTYHSGWADDHMASPATAYGASSAGGDMGDGGFARHLDPDRVPLTTREIDDFSRGFLDALGRIGEEDEDEISGSSSGNVNGVMGGVGSNGQGSPRSDGPPSEGATPLWQQGRRRSRNLMWM